MYDNPEGSGSVNFKITDPRRICYFKIEDPSVIFKIEDSDPDPLVSITRIRVPNLFEKTISYIRRKNRCFLNLVMRFTLP